MNLFTARVKEIKNLDTLHIVSFDFEDIELKMMSLELNETIKENTKVKLIVKPTHVSFAKDFKGEISISNKLLGKVKEINEGELLSSIIFEVKNTQIESVFTSSFLKANNIKIDEEYTLFIKASDLSIREICDE